MNSEIHYQSVQQALSLVESGHRLFIHGSACTPVFLMQHLAQRKDELQNVELVFISVYGDIVVDRPEFANSFHINTMFVSHTVRAAVNEGRADFIPVFLSEIPQLFKRGALPIDG